jgi:hypothetical protein
MRSLKFLTWLDVKRLIQKKTLNGGDLPEGISSISCFSDALEIGILGTHSKEDAQRILDEWFDEWYQQDQDCISLDLGDVTLPVEFYENEPAPSNDSVSIRPFWQEIAYIDNKDADSVRKSSRFHFPEPFLNKPRVIAFYSFKGGVGRTLHLASHLFALLDASKELGASKEIDRKVTILVIDADLEAPGLTYWDRADKQQSAISFIDFLEAYHYSSVSREDTLTLLAEEIKKTPRYDGGSTYYFLPACLNDEQLLDTPVLPEHLARNLESEWTCGDAIHQLGEVLSVDYVLVDLRAGLSEISSPIIFDPRIQRFFVTTATEQSVAGVSLVLELTSRIAPLKTDSSNGTFYDPSIIISFLTPELKKLPAFEKALEKLSAAYNFVDQSDDDNLSSGRLAIKETDFTQELLYINSWDEARDKLKSTSVMKIAKEWAISQLKEDFPPIDSVHTEQDTSIALEAVQKFRDVCKQYEFAESGEGESLLVTESLKNLANNFRNDLPRIVSIGAKGSGKTFTYVQLSRLQFWEKFLKISIKDLAETQHETHIFPLLQSSTLKDVAKNIIDDTRKLTQQAFRDPISEFYHSNFQDSIRSFLAEPRDELKWKIFWIQQLSKSVGLTQTENSESLSALNNYLKQQGVRLIFLFDGLEDIFAEASTNLQQQTALKALIDLPNSLNEIRQANFGLIILLRRDFLRYSVTQNLAQFESLYSPYDLFWDADSFLKLVYWVCSQAGVIGASKEKLDILSREELVSNLEKLWGKKLGGDTSKEAYTAKWIYAALTDFKGRLQARDVVRLLHHAADISIRNSGEVQFDRWSANANRLLPPQAIRQAIEPCSTKKVDEVKEEYPAFKKWLDIASNYTTEQKRAPFTQDTLSLDQATIKMLEDIGVIYADRGKDDVLRYYMPEIYRSGLKFSLEKGARPRVLILKRKALGADIL